MNHPLAEAIIAQARSRKLAPAALQLDYGAHDGRISILEPFLGKSGWLTLSLLTVESLNQAEDHLVFSAIDDDEQPLEQDVASRLLSLPGTVSQGVDSVDNAERLEAITNLRQQALGRVISLRNSRFFEAEAEKLNGWADDQLASAERALTETKRRIRELRNQAVKVTSMEEQARIQSDIRDAERRQRKLRQEIFEVEDQILAKRDELVESVRGMLKQSVSTSPLFTIRWTLTGAQKQSEERLG